MKKICSIFALSALIFAGVAAAQDDTNAVYSANAVGVIKYTIPAAGELVCISLPLNPMTGGSWQWVDTEIAKNLPNGSQVYFWSGSSWSVSTKNLKTGVWQGATTKVIEPGEAFFVRGLKSSQSPLVISILGEVPDDDTLEYSITGSKNLDMRAVTMYPVAVTFGETELANSLPNGSQVYFWTGSSWAVSTKNQKTGVWPTASRAVSIGEGVFVKSSGSADTIVMECPY